jgi:hypothetical protein
MMGTFIVFGLFFGGMMWACYALLCNWLFRLMLKGTGLPKSMKLEYKRERMMTFIVFLSLPMSWLGVVPLIVAYVAGLSAHFRQRRKVDAGEIDVSAIPIVPRMALNELMVMVFSMAFFPVLVGAIIDAVLAGSLRGSDPNVKTAITVSAFVIGVLIFPLCFASAYHRLEYHRIKDPRSRMAFLFVYPYMTFAMHILLWGSIVAVFAFGVLIDSNNRSDNNVLISVSLVVLSALAVMLTGVAIGKRAIQKRNAEESAQLPQDQTPVS